MHINTKCVQAGYTPENGQPRQIPIIQSTTFKYSTSEDMGKLFDLEASGYFYTRLQNPTNDAVAVRVGRPERDGQKPQSALGGEGTQYRLYHRRRASDPWERRSGGQVRQTGKDARRRRQNC